MSKICPELNPASPASSLGLERAQRSRVSLTSNVTLVRLQAAEQGAVSKTTLSLPCGICASSNAIKHRYYIPSLCPPNVFRDKLFSANIFHHDAFSSILGYGFALEISSRALISQDTFRAIYQMNPQDYVAPALHNDGMPRPSNPNSAHVQSLSTASC
jgi:hypothetical protein